MSFNFKLTKKQADTLNDQLTTRKHWTTRIHVVKAQIKSYQIDISDDQLDEFMHTFVPSEIKRHQREYHEKVRTGILKTSYTPTDVKGTFGIVTDPIIDRNYHISWAYSGAIFKLKRIEGNTAYLDNPKHKRKTLITCKLSELRETAKRTEHKGFNK